MFGAATLNAQGSTHWMLQGPYCLGEYELSCRLMVLPNCAGPKGRLPSMEAPYTFLGFV
jgi:hypothetical protein